MKERHFWFYVQIYGVGHMVKDHTDNVRENLLPPLQGLQGIFDIHHIKR